MSGVSCRIAVRYSDNEYLRQTGHAGVRELLRLPLVGRTGRFLAAYLANGMSSRRAIRQGGFDVFHPTFFDNYFLGRLRERPFVLTVFDMIPERFPELFPRRTLYQRRVTGRWIDNKARLVRHAACVIAISEQTKSDLVAFYGIDAARVHVTWLAGSLGHGLEAPPRPAQRPYVLFVGTRHGYKNFSRFVQAMRPLMASDPSLEVRCIGGGRFSPDERNMLDELRIGARISQHELSDAQLAMAYRHAEAFVFPSQYEGFGIPIVEAMSCGCPCIISRASCFPEIASDAAEYFDPGDVDSMSSSIARVLSVPERRAQLISGGHLRSREFSWDRTASRTLGVYRLARASRA